MKMGCCQDFLSGDVQDRKITTWEAMSQTKISLQDYKGSDSADTDLEAKYIASLYDEHH